MKAEIQQNAQKTNHCLDITQKATKFVCKNKHKLSEI